MKQKMNEKLKNILEKLPKKVARALEFSDAKTLENLCEIRLRKNMPVVLTLKEKSLYLLGSGGVLKEENDMCVYISQEELATCFLNLCNHSVYAHAAEIKEGYISLENGCRAGLAGRFFEGEISEVYSINIRLSKQVTGCALPLKGYLDKGLLIAGPPGSGKTTLLRDAVRLLSQDKTRVAVIDSREEISTGFDLGAFTDVVVTKEKAKGAEIALRTLNPQVIAFDEIATTAELKSVNDMLNAGVKIITTAHLFSKEEARLRPVTARLLDSGAIEYIAFLNPTPGSGIKILKKGEISIAAI